MTRHGHATLALALTMCTVASKALAQTPEALVRRQQLLDRLEEAHRAERHTEALQLALQAGEIRMTPSIRMYIAEANSALGNPREALESAQLCVSEAVVTPNVNNRDRILERCRRIVEAVQQRTGTVVVRVPDPRTPGLRVWVGQTELPQELWGRAIPTPAGPTRVEASASGGNSLLA